MTILLTGGAGRTSTAVAKRLHEAKIPFVVLSRTGSAPEPFTGCRFDWNDQDTYGIPFSKANDVDAVYIVVPITVVDENATPVTDFIDFAKARGVKRFVALTSSNALPGKRIMGVVHDHLMSLGVDWTVLRPTWYMENFSRNHARSIREEGKIYSAAGDGKVSWISTEDVGSVVYRTLTEGAAVANTDHILLGPELLSYDDVAKILSDVIGREIQHARISIDMLKNGLETFGLAPVWTKVMLDMEVEFANGEEARLDNGEVMRITGHAPVDFRTWAEKNKNIWI